jgi:hypothetical protein
MNDETRQVQQLSTVIMRSIHGILAGRLMAESSSYREQRSNKHLIALKVPILNVTTSPILFYETTLPYIRDEKPWPQKLRKRDVPIFPRTEVDKPTV